MGCGLYMQNNFTFEELAHMVDLSAQEEWLRPLAAVTKLSDYESPLKELMVNTTNSDELEELTTLKVLIEEALTIGCVWVSFLLGVL